MSRAEQAGDLRGLTVGLLQARHGRELVALVEKHGGVAVHAPCMREIPAEDREAMCASLQRAVEGPLYMAVFLTGVGVAALFNSAVEAGVYEALMARLLSAIVVARGPKPLAVLHRHGLPVDRRTIEPHTTDQVCALVSEPLMGRTVLLQHYGAKNELLAGHLRRAGAELIEVYPYEWGEPVDVGPVHALLDRLVAGEVDITAFTSASQVHILFQIARAQGREVEVGEALRHRTVTAALGPVCAAALHDHGVSPRIQPEWPKMAPLVASLCAFAAVFAPRQPGRIPADLGA